MARTLSAAAEAERVKDGVSGVWLISASLDEWGYSTLNKYYASRDIELADAYPPNVFVANYGDYAGTVAEGGIDFGMLRVKPQGGLAPVYSWSIRLRDEDGGSSVTDTHVISNDPVIAYFIMPTASPVNADRIEIMRGVIERNTTTKNVWTLRIKDDSKKDLKQIPTTTVDPVTYPYAYQLGAVIPECFGELKNAPQDHAKDRTLMAPVRFTDRFALKGTSSLRKKAGTDAYQWYNAARRFGKISGTSESAGVLTMVNPTRTMYMRPSRAKGTNNVSDWYKVADRDESVTVTLSSGSNLDMYLSGSSSLGTLTALSVEVEATGSYTLTIKDDTTSLFSDSRSGNASESLTAASYVAWDLDLLNVEIDGPGSGSATIKEVYLKVTFDDMMAFSESEPAVFQMVEGFQDVAGNYNNGAVQVAGSTAIRNPVYQLQALLRAKNLNDLPVAQIDTTMFTAAAASRSSWYFDFFMREQVSDTFLDRFCFQAGLMLWNADGKWKVAALDKSRAVDHFFLGGYSMPVVGPVDQPQQQQYDLEVMPPDASKIFNEIAIRYALHPATGDSQAAEVASGQYRLSGTCATAESGNTLIDGSATFESDNVVVNELIYIEGDTDYKVVSVTNETTLVIAAVDGSATTTDLSAEYYLGPNINGDAFVSQQAYKVVNALGGNRQRTFLDDGGYKSELITDDSTAVLLKDHALEWFSQPRDRIRFSLMHDGLAVEPGDLLYLDHPKFKASQRGIDKTQTTEAVDSTETVISVTSGEAGLFRANDYVYMQESPATAPECMKVASTDVLASTLTVVRAQLGTTAQTFSLGKYITHVKTKWIVTGVKAMTPRSGKIQIEAEETPPAYFPTGICSNETALYVDVTATERYASGWATLRNGRATELDPDSAISYAG
mgnify:FL=1